MQINNPLRHPHLAEHQTEAVVAASYIHGQESRIQVIMACGTGKTRVGAAIALETSPANTIVYLPSLALIRQTLPEWLRTPFPGGFEFLCVCSDQTVAAADEARVTVEELQQEFGAGRRRVTTSSEEVRVFLEAPAAMKVLFVTYHSADVVRDGLPDSLAFDLGIYDEAHRTAGKGSRFNATLQDTHTPIARRVFMTATPKHSDYRHRNKEGEAKVVFSMDDESVYGKVAYRLPIREAIHRGIITDYKILISVITDQAIADDFAQRGLRKPDNSDKIDLGVHAMAITNAMERYGLCKAITFHNSVNHAAAMTDTRITNFPGDLARFHVSGIQPTGDRNKTLSKFAAAARGLVTNARCLTEGIDVPEIDLVTFVHPKKSRVDIVQAVGRAMRRSPSSNKACGYILLPLFVHEATCSAIQEKVLSESSYDAIWQTIQALREQDEMLDAVIREGVMTGSAGGLSKFIHIDGPVSRELKDFIGTVCLDELGESWDRYYGILKQLFESVHDVSVPKRAVIDGLNVGSWLTNQRAAFKAGQLSPERIAKLEAIGIVWDPLEAAWESHYAILKRLFEDGQNANVLHNSVIDELNVGTWLNNQRSAAKAGNLSSARIAKLEAIGIVWDQLEAAWESHYVILKRLFEDGQNVNALHKSIIDGLNVETWLGHQRTVFKAGQLSLPRIDKLEAIGIVWYQLEATWERHYAILKRLFEDGQNANVLHDSVIDGLKVGRWLSGQRGIAKVGELSPERIAKLEAIGIVWDPLEAAWESHYAILKRLFEDGQDANIRGEVIVNGLKVGQWLRSQRELFKKSRMSPDRISKMQSIGITWDPMECVWREYYTTLKNLSDDGKDTNVPMSAVIDGLKVGKWLRGQVQLYRAGRMSRDHSDKLEAIGIVWDSLEKKWDKFYDVLKRLRENYQNANVASDSVIDGLQMGIWLNNQRQLYRAGRLPHVRITKLEAIGIVWDPLEAAWDAHYAVLKNLFDDGHNPNACHGKVIAGHNVGLWWSRQRNEFRKGNLSPERIAKLEAIGIVWDPLEAAWDAHYAVLKNLFDDGHNPNVPNRKVIDGLRVGAWLSNQRTHGKTGKLSPERIAKLEEIGVRLTK